MNEHFQFQFLRNLINNLHNRVRELIEVINGLVSLLLMVRTLAELDAIITLATATPGIKYTATVAADITVPSPRTVPANLSLIFVHDGRFTKSGTGTVTFQGVGLFDPESRVPVFEGFSPGDVTWTGATADLRPAAITTELWDTGNNSLMDRLRRANTAISGNYWKKIVCYPRDIDGVATFPSTATEGAVEFRTKTEVFFTPGDYEYTYDGFWIGCFSFNDDNIFHGTWGARLGERATAGQQMFQPQNRDNFGQYENVIIKNLAFIGNDAGAGSSAGSKISLGNAKNCVVEDCLFYRTHDYTITVGGYGDTGFCAENVTLRNNRFIGNGSQVIAPLNAKNLMISGNYFDQRSSNNASTYTVLDVEPNTTFDVMDNLVIENNIFDSRDNQDIAPKYHLDILIQGTDHRGNRNVTVRHNTIYGSNILPDPGAADPGEQSAGPGGVLLWGIAGGGIEELYCYGNTIRGGAWGSMSWTGVRDGSIYDNDFILPSQVTGLDHDQLKLVSCVNCTVTDNRFHITTVEELPYQTVVNQRGGIYELDRHRGCTINGTAVTILFFADSNGDTERVYKHYKDLSVLINDALHEVVDVPTHASMTLGSSPGVIPQSSFTSANVNAGTDTFNVTGHGFVTGAQAFLVTSGVLPAHTPPPVDPISFYRVYYIIRVDDNNFKLAYTRDEAIALTAIDFTDGGTGTHKIAPLMHFVWSRNTYKDNKNPTGLHLSPTGVSVIESTAHDGVVTDVADTDYTVPAYVGIISYTSLTAPRTVTLPPADTCKGKEIAVQDGAGAAETHNITVDGDGYLINGAPTHVIDTNWGAARFKSIGVGWITVARVGGVTSSTATSIDNTVARFDGVGGNKIQGSLVIVSDEGGIDIPDQQQITSNGNFICNYSSLSGAPQFGGGTSITLLAAGQFVGTLIAGAYKLIVTAAEAIVPHTSQFGWTPNIGVVGPDTGLEREAAAVVGVTDGSTGRGWIQTAGEKRVTADVVNVGVAPANITDLSATLAAGRTYAGKITLHYEAATAADGFRFDLDGGAATVTDLRLNGKITDSAGCRLLGQSTALATDLTDTTTTGPALVEVDFTVTVNAGGTLIPRFAKEADAAGANGTVYRGSWMELTDIS